MDGHQAWWACTARVFNMVRLSIKTPIASHGFIFEHLISLSLCALTAPHWFILHISQESSLLIPRYYLPSSFITQLARLSPSIPMTTKTACNKDDDFPVSVPVPSECAPATLGSHELTEEERVAYSNLFLDVESTRDTNTAPDFPFPPSELLEMCRYANLRLLGFDDFSVLSDDFIFRGPVVGPLTRAELRDTFTTFDLKIAFSGSPRMLHNLWVDPHQPSRVFWAYVTDAVHRGQLGHIAPTGKHVRTPPQVASFNFNNEGKVNHLTAGYVLDRDVGNTGGMGGLFGVLYAVGHPLPIPECKPYRNSWQFWLLQKIEKLSKYFKGGTQTKTIKDNETESVPTADSEQLKQDWWPMVW